MKDYSSDKVLAKFEVNLGKIEAGKEGIHQALIMALQHVYHHGNWKVFVTLVSKLEDSDKNLSSEAKAVVEWAVIYGGLETNDEGFCGWSGKEHIKDKFQEARANPFWKKQKVEKPFEFSDIAILEAWLSKRQNAKKKAAKDGEATVVFADDIATEVAKMIKDMQTHAQETIETEGVPFES